MKNATIKKWFGGEMTPYLFSRYYIRRTHEVEETGIVEGELIRQNFDDSFTTIATFRFSRVDWSLETHSLLMRQNSKLAQGFDDAITKMMTCLYPDKITLSPKKNKEKSEPLGVDDIKNAAFLMFESLKNTVLLDEENLIVLVIRRTDKDTDDVTMTTFVIDKDEDVVPWTQALAEMSHYTQVDSDALEEFFLHRLPEA